MFYSLTMMTHWRKSLELNRSLIPPGKVRRISSKLKIANMVSKIFGVCNTVLGCNGVESFCFVYGSSLLVFIEWCVPTQRIYG